MKKGIICFLSVVLLFVNNVAFANLSNEQVRYVQKLNRKGIKLEKHKKYNQAEDVFNQALEFCSKNSDDAWKSCILYNIAIIYSAQNNNKQAETFFKQAIYFQEKVNDPKILQYNYINFALTYMYFTQDELLLKRYDEAVVSANKAFNIAQKNNDIQLELRALNAIALVYMTQNNLTEVEHSYSLILPLMQKTEKKDSPLLKDYLFAYYGVCIRNGNYSKAADLLINSILPIYDKKHVKAYRVEYAYTELILAYKDNNEKALFYKQKLFQYIDEKIVDNRYKNANFYFDYAYIFDRIGEYDKAITYYQKELSILNTEKNKNFRKLLEYIGYFNIAKDYDALNQHDKAIIYHDKANILKKDIPQKDLDKFLNYVQ